MKIIKLITVLIIVSTFFSCDDFIEPNIDNKIISLISPPDTFRSSSVTQTFWWNELDGAENYNLQIVKGTFSYVQLFILDTTVVTNKFQYSLSPGTYQWRVRGENNGGNTTYSTRTLTIDSTLDLSLQTVLLIAPVENFTTNQTSITFDWQSLYNADEYRLQIIDTTNSTTVVDVIQSGTTYSYILPEGGYIWQVRAQNSVSISPFSSRKLNVDLTAPSVPILVSPINNAMLTLGSNDSLTWQADASSFADSLFIDTDSTFSNPSKIYSNTTYYTLIQSAGTYFWKVKSMDSAGNQSDFSAYRKFYLQ